MSTAAIALSRFGLGARRGEIAPADPALWLERQIEGFDPRPQLLAARASSREQLSMLVAEIIAYRQQRQSRKSAMQVDGAEQGDFPRSTMRRLAQSRETYVDDISLRGNLALTSPTPFIERLVHFWANHFAISVSKAQVASVAGPHEFDAIRSHVTGNFRDLLRAAVLHPAMLAYLDQYQSIGPNSRAGTFSRQRRGREPGLNENLAREILELHTLGVDGGYSQNDVTEFARALTGWTLSGLGRGRNAEPNPDGSGFLAIAHEPGSRSILGRSYRDNGRGQALAVLDDLAAHPATARHIATKLARHFAGDAPPEAMIIRIETAFLASNGDLPAVYRATIASPEAWVPTPVHFRQPWEWVIALGRSVGLEEFERPKLAGLMRELGQVPWAPPSPAGYDDLDASWAGPDALIRRAEAAERMARLFPALDVPSLARQIFPGSLGEATFTGLRQAESGEQALALLFVSPEMLRR